MSTPVVSLDWFTVRLTAKKPTRTTNWKVQYFNGGTALTTASTTIPRRVELEFGTYAIQARWTKPGETTILTGVKVVLESFSIRASCEKPTDEANWKVEYFNTGASITSSSKTIGRRVQLLPGFISITATWTKVDDSVETGAVEFYVSEPTYDEDDDSVTFVLGDPIFTDPPDVPEPPVPPPAVNCEVSPWGAWSEWTAVNATLETRSRSRTIVVPPSNGGAACPSLTQIENRAIAIDPPDPEPDPDFPPIEPPNPPFPIPVPPPTPDPDPDPDPIPPEPPPPAPVPSGDARLITSADLQYLGAMRCPEFARMDFSYGQMTGRRVAGKVHLLMSGNVTLHDPIYEFMDTESYSPTTSAAPRMELVREWGDIYGGLRYTFDVNGDIQPVQGRFPGNLYWHEANQLLYWTYANGYNVSQFPDWCLGASRLNSNGTATAYGPWRPEGTRIGPRTCTRLAMSPSGEMLCGATLSSGNASSPWGPDLHGGAWPTVSTPVGFTTPNIPVDKYLTYYSMIGNVNLNGTFDAPILSCRRPGTYIFEPFQENLVAIDPTLNGNVGSWTDLDVWGGVSWIDLEDRYGVLFTGMLAAGHVWYASGLNNYTCTHGQPSPVDVTGPVSTDGYPTIWIYDPNDLIDVRNGDTTDYTVDPAETIDAEDEYGLVSSNIGMMGSAKSLVGQYFDTVTRRLYVCAPEADRTIGGFILPLVHVFLVN